MHPWISIWVRPRATIAHIVAKNPNQGIWLLAWMYGFLSLLNGGQSFGLGTRVPFFLIILFSLLIAPIWGMMIFAIWSWVILMVGKMLKGQGSFSYVRAAFAWSCAPFTINIALWILLLSVFRGSLFRTIEVEGTSLNFLMILLIFKLAIVIWSLVIFIHTLAEVQKFSIGHSIANIILSWIGMGLVIALVGMGVGYFANASFLRSEAAFHFTLGVQL